MAKKKKFYVVWAGHKPGVYSSWDEANAQIAGFSGAKFKSFASAKAAEEAFKDPADMHYGKGPKKPKTPKRSREELADMGVDMTASPSMQLAKATRDRSNTRESIWKPISIYFTSARWPKEQSTLENS